MQSKIGRFLTQVNFTEVIRSKKNLKRPKKVPKTSNKSRVSLMFVTTLATFQAGEEEKDGATVVAEKRFFQLLKQQKDERLQLGKPLVFNDEE